MLQVLVMHLDCASVNRIKKDNVTFKRQNLLDAASEMYRSVTGYNSLCKSGCNKSTPLD